MQRILSDLLKPRVDGEHHGVAVLRLDGHLGVLIAVVVGVDGLFAVSTLEIFLHGGLDAALAYHIGHFIAVGLFLPVFLGVDSADPAEDMRGYSAVGILPHGDDLNVNALIEAAVFLDK